MLNTLVISLAPVNGNPTQTEWLRWGIWKSQRLKDKSEGWLDFSHIFETIQKIRQKSISLWRIWLERKFQIKFHGAIKENKPFVDLKTRLCQATIEPLQIVDFSKPYVIEVGSSDSTIGAVLLQSVPDQGIKPVAFASQKLTSTQKSWSTIEKRSICCHVGFGKFRGWIFHKPVSLYSDHNSLTFITESATKSSKLMRWALPLQQHDVTFKFKAGRVNVVADCLSTLDD